MAYWYYNSYESIQGLIHTTKVYNSAMTFPFIYGNVTYDMTHRPYQMTLQRATNQGFEGYTGDIYIYPVSGSSLSLYIVNSQTREKKGYNRIINSDVELSDIYLTRLSTTTISGRFRFKSSVLQTTPTNLTSSSIPVNVSINDKQYKCIVFPAGARWLRYNEFERYIPNAAVGGFSILPQDFSKPQDLTFFTTDETSATLKSEYVNMIWDFGSLPQEVPQTFIDWITQNSDIIYPYKYTIKSPDSMTLAEQGELPPIRNITLSTIGNNVNMILTGSNGVNYTLTWSHTVPEGKTFLGLGYSATDKRASIPSGTTTAVTWDSDITVYEIYGKYVPPATTFTITLYQNTAENNRVDKTNYLTSVGSINGVLRSECSIIRPSIIIAQDTLPTFNYVYIAVFGRYYFVTGITSVNFGLWRIELNTDVLMTYQTGVKALTAIIARQENDYNDNLIDTEIPTEKEPTIIYQEIPNTVLNTQEDSDKHSFVITVVGN